MDLEFPPLHRHGTPPNSGGKSVSYSSVVQGVPTDSQVDREVKCRTEQYQKSDEKRRGIPMKK